MVKRYLPWDPADGESGGRGYPVGPTLFYKCGVCGDAIRSEAGEGEPWECSCRNVFVDPPQGRVGIKDNSKPRIFRDWERAAAAVRK